MAKAKLRSTSAKYDDEQSGAKKLDNANIELEFDIEAQEYYVVWQPIVLGYGRTEREALEDLRGAAHFGADSLINSKLKDIEERRDRGARFRRFHCDLHRRLCIAGNPSFATGDWTGRGLGTGPYPTLGRSRLGRKSI